MVRRPTRQNWGSSTASTASTARTISTASTSSTRTKAPAKRRAMPAHQLLPRFRGERWHRTTFPIRRFAAPKVVANGLLVQAAAVAISSEITPSSTAVLAFGIGDGDITANQLWGRRWYRAHRKDKCVGS
jgi:hypothetical protein